MFTSSVRSTAIPAEAATRTVLVVEDEDCVRDMLTEFLSDAGYRVFEATNVAQAKTVVLTRRPVDLVFSDINMPGHEDGFALAIWLRHQHPAIKVLLTSGVPHLRERTRDLAEPLMAKPYKLSFLVQRIRVMLN